VPALTTIVGVELCRVGTWHASTGTWNCTAAQLASAVQAASDPAFRPAVVKIGHDDPRFNDAKGDGEPAIGRVVNLRLSEDGQVLIGDLEGVPAWLAEIIQSAFPSRSIEANLGVETADGNVYPMVLTGLALLGVQAPAIENLADIASLYDVDTAVDTWVAASAVAATFKAPEATMTEPRKVAASASITALCDAAEEWIKAQEMFSDWAYVKEIWTDTLIVRDDEDDLWRVPWTESNGTFTFGDPQEVMVTYTPVADTVEARAARKMHQPLFRALPSRRGRDPQITTDPQEQPVAIEPSALRDRLGLSAEADDEAILAALDARLAEPPAQVNGPEDEDAEKTEDTEDPAPAMQEDPRVALLLQQVADLQNNLNDRAEAERLAARAAVIGGAVKAGKILLAAREDWERLYDADPATTAATLAKIPGSTAMTVAASGAVGTEPTDDLDSEWRTFIAPALGIRTEG
jgi:hypothetical protein